MPPSTLTSDAEPGDPTDESLIAAESRRRAEDEAAAERVEVEWAATSWTSLLTPSSEVVITARMLDGSTVTGKCTDGGRGWVLLEVDGREVMLNSGQVLTLSGATSPAPAGGSVQRGMGSVLRRWARHRSAIVVHLVNGDRVRGTVQEVLSDAVVVAAELEPPQRMVIPMSSVVLTSTDSIVV